MVIGLLTQVRGTYTLVIRTLYQVIGFKTLVKIILTRFGYGYTDHCDLISYPCDRYTDPCYRFSDSGDTFSDPSDRHTNPGDT